MAGAQDKWGRNGGSWSRLTSAATDQGAQARSLRRAIRRYPPISGLIRP